MRPFNLQLCALLLCGFAFQGADGQPVLSPPSQTNAVQAEMDKAIHQVERIVNQPVTAYQRARGMHVAVYKEGWFHPGALKPDFNTVDVRTTQETPYAQYQYVSSGLNPGLVFLGTQLEFNPMTKYFYTNRTLPKKKLTEAEMEEINQLYRIIGRCEQQLSPAQTPTPDAAAGASEGNDTAQSTSGSKSRPRLLNPYVGGGAIVVLGLVLLLSFSRRAG